MNWFLALGMLVFANSAAAEYRVELADKNTGAISVLINVECRRTIRPDRSEKYECSKLSQKAIPEKYLNHILEPRNAKGIYDSLTLKGVVDTPAGRVCARRDTYECAEFTHVAGDKVRKGFTCKSMAQYQSEEAEVNESATQNRVASMCDDPVKAAPNHVETATGAGATVH